MPKLGCSAENCANNNQNYCCISNIKVAGKEAIESSSTCCHSFVEKNDSFTNCTTEPNPNVDVACKATNCVHNANCRCGAESIDIQGQSACNCNETECSTFSCK